MSNTITSFGPILEHLQLGMLETGATQGHIHLRSCTHNRWKHSNQTDRADRTLGSLANCCSSPKPIKAMEILARGTWDQWVSPPLAVLFPPLCSLFLFFPVGNLTPVSAQHFVHLTPRWIETRRLYQSLAIVPLFY